MNPSETSLAGQPGFWAEFNALGQCLLEDLRVCATIVRNHDSPLARRNLVRALFAAVEGTAWAMKSAALHAHEMGDVRFSATELSILSESQAELKDNGQTDTRRLPLRLKGNLQFAFRSFANGTQATFQLDTKSEGWAALLEASQIRDRLMHPKDSKSLEVTDRERNLVETALEWWMKQIIAVMAEATEKLRGPSS